MLTSRKLGWIGIGRMGHAMAERLAKAGCDLTVWNRTRAKAEPLAKLGVKIASRPADLAGCDIVFVVVSTGQDVMEMVEALCAGGRAPKVVVDSTSISIEDSERVRQRLAAAGAQLLAAPVSGNAKVIQAGKLTFVCSGPRPAFDAAEPYLGLMGSGASYVGEGELSRIAKICHNVYLGIVIQALAEITLLAQKAGMSRHAFLDFLNRSVMGSTFSRYKTPALVNLDFRVTFTPRLLRKDLDLGLDAARALEVPMPLATLTRELVQAMIGHGMTEKDFSELLVLQARASGLELQPENVEVGDGLS
ncbi:MAG: NAD(P)-dependent oxidoreductase [Betaproteobacteria bacterium]|nr:MAG: NAD(P)-dependent oxidoreductase [Betaproteobacteria bacterium]